MNKIIALAALIAMVGTLTFGVTGCTKSEESAVERKVEQPAAQYACSMKCEGEKTYSSAGSCPTCGMALKKVE